jgi:hypothetical protein
VIVGQYGDATPAGGRVDAGNLPIAADVVDRNREFHQVQVEAALRILARIAQPQEIEHRLDVGVEPVVTLARERDVPVVERSD